MSTSAVKFRAEAWGAEETDAHEAELFAMERFVRQTQGYGLTDDEISEDLQAQWPHLGTVQVITTKTAYSSLTMIEIIAD